MARSLISLFECGSSGLLVTYVALNLMDGHGQPALLYIVPFTLGKLLSVCLVCNFRHFSSKASVTKK